MNFGKKLKELRVKKGLTQEELGDRTELSKGFISQVERNLTSPSIATLTDILECLGTSLGEFFKEQNNEKIVFRTADYALSEKENHRITWLVPNAQKLDMEPILLELPAHGRSFDMPPASGEEFGYVLEGGIVLCCDDNRYTVKKGESFYIKCNTFHHLENSRKTPAKVLWISTPPAF